MDIKDEKIIQILRENSHQSIKKMSKKAKLPITTIHNRIRKLVAEGVIRRFTVELDQHKLGKTISAYVLITVDYTQLKKRRVSQADLCRIVRQHEGVEESAVLTGGADILIKIRLTDMEALNQFITVYLRNIEGIDKTQTMVVLEEV